MPSRWRALRGGGATAWADDGLRSGALTVSELAAAGVAALLVPYPHAVDDHQTANATPMMKAGAAAIIQEAELSDASLADELKRWLTSRTDLLERAQRARRLARPQALQRITELCLQLAGDPA